MNSLTDSSHPLSSCTRFLAIAAILAAGGTGAHAQEAPTRSEMRLEEIVVTAQKREQTLRQIPQSVTVLGGQLLERRQADNFKEYLALIPGLSLETGAQGQSRITLRGINTGGVATTVGVYVDEVPYGSSTGLANAAVLSGEFDTFDAARLEVLRGPQGTLYGASSLGGVLRLVTNPPSVQGFEARAQAGVEDTEGGDVGWSAKGMVNLPVSDRFALRASGYYRFDDGFIDSIGNNPIPSLLDPTVNIVDGTRTAGNINEHETLGGRVSGLFESGAGLSVRLTALLQSIRNDAGDTFEGDPETYAPLYGGLVASQYHTEPSDIDYRIYSATVEADTGAGSLLSSTSYSTFEHDFQADIALMFGPTATLLFGDATDRPLSVIQRQITSTDKFTQEFRFTSPDDENFEWLVGAFYSREDSQIGPQDFFMVEAGTDTIAEDLPLFANGRVPSEYEEYAAFGNATWHLSERFDLTFGARASRNDQSASQFLDLSSIGGGITEFDEVSSSEDVFTWSVAPRFVFDDGSAVYLRIATGYRPGGPNVLPPTAPPGTPGSYDADRLTSYEIGLKGDWLDDRLSLDVAAFWLDWEDIQLFVVVDNVGLNANGETAVSKGLEFTAAARPIDNLTLSLNGAWTDAYLTEDTHPTVGGLDDDPLPWVPEWNATFSLNYEWSVGGEMTAWIGGDLSYTGERTSDFDFRDGTGALRELPSYERVGLRAGIDTGRWSLEAYAQNLTDERGITSLGGYDPTAVPNSAATVSIIRPRTVGLTVGMEF